MALQALRGKFVRRDEAGNLIFGSQKKPEWRPMSPACDSSMLVPGEYFEIQVDANKVYAITALGAMPESARTASPARSGTGGGLSERDLFTCATGVVKSALESGSTHEEAFRAGLRWVRAWQARNAPPEAPQNRPQAPIPSDLPDYTLMEDSY